MKRFLGSPIVALLLLVAFGFASYGAWNAWKAFRETNREEKELAEKVKNAESELLRLREEIRLSKTPEAIERDAKERLNLKKPGEEVVVVIPSVATSSSVEVPKPTFWARLIGWLTATF